MTAVVLDDRRRLGCGRRGRRHIGMERRGMGFAAAMRAAMINLGIGKQVVGWRWLLGPLHAMRHHLGRARLGDARLCHAGRRATGKMRHRLVAALGLDEREVLARRRMMRRCVHLGDFERAGVILGGGWSVEAGVADVMLGGAGSREAVSRA